MNPAADTRRRQSLAAVGLAIAALHGIGLYGIAGAALPPSSRATQPVVMHVALLSVVAVDAPSVPVPVPLQAIGGAPPQAPPAEVSTTPATPVVAGPQAPADAGTRFAAVPALPGEPDSFIRLGELSRPAEWLSPGIPPAAPDPTELEQGLEVTLYLDEAGRVAALHTDDETRLSEAQAWLAQALAHGRFRPAEIDDSPVRSRLQAFVWPSAEGARVWFADTRPSR